MGVAAPGATAGGTALLIPMLVEDLQRGGRFEIDTIPYGRHGEGQSLPAKIATQLLELGRFPFRVLRASPDVVHLHSAFDRKAIVRDIHFALATRILRRPLLIQWHGSQIELLHTSSPIWWLASRLLLRLVDAVAVLSTEEQSEVLESGVHRPCHVVKNGLDLQRYAHPREVRDRLAIPPDAPLLLFIARLMPAKGLLDTIEALERLRSRVPHLVVVGAGPSRASAAERVRQLRLEERVHFVGQIPEDEARDFYCGCDILVLPTYHPEGFPMSIFQSVASGLGIVTTRIRAAADYLQEPDHCLFVPPRDPDALAAALERLIAEPQLLQKMRQQNRTLARRFERRSVAAEFADIYDSLA
jgi:glycosyltransferase involved in cell wall biosynthesis